MGSKEFKTILLLLALGAAAYFFVQKTKENQEVRNAQQEIIRKQKEAQKAKSIPKKNGRDNGTGRTAKTLKPPSLDHFWLPIEFTNHHL